MCVRGVCGGGVVGRGGAPTTTTTTSTTAPTPTLAPTPSTNSACGSRRKVPGSADRARGGAQHGKFAFQGLLQV